MAEFDVANPAPLGLFAFAFTTALLQGANTAITSVSFTKAFTFSFGMFYGGLAQLLAGQWEFKRKNTFAATAFSSYGAFWMGLSIFGMLAQGGVYKFSSTEEAASAYQIMLILWGIVTFLFFLQTLAIHFALALLFSSLAILFFLLAIGEQYVGATRTAGWFGFFVAAVAFYIGTSELTVDVYGTRLLPVGGPLIKKPAASGRMSTDSAQATAEHKV